MQGAARRRRWPARSTRAPPSSRQAPDARVRAGVRRLGALDRRAGRQADRRRRRAAAAASRHRRRAAHRRVARGGADAARSLAQDITSSGCSAPLFALAAAEDITGIARGVAFQLIEALGVLERQKVAEDVKGLDQAVARDVAQIRRALRRLSSLPAGAAEARAAQPRGAAVDAQARQPGRPRASTSCSGLRRAAAPRSRSTRTCRSRSIAPSAIACAASARSASTFWSGSPT